MSTRLAHILQPNEKGKAIMEWAALSARALRRDQHWLKMRDPVRRMRSNLRRRVWNALMSQSAKKHRRKMLDCTTAQLRLHLETLWKPGMSWENYGEWHVDHIKPVAAFDLRKPSQQRACFHWSNLQPLWGKENFLKGDTWVEPE